jgi:prepilin-type N-terminal cleavage/methylation domain-containing protein
MPRADAPRAGVALLEVLVALMILGIAGAAAITLAVDAGNSLRRAQTAEGEMRAANAFLDRVSLWGRGDLDRRLGERLQGQWRLRIDRPAPTLYVVELRDSSAQRVLLRTAIFRADSSRQGDDGATR